MEKKMRSTLLRSQAASSTLKHTVDSDDFQSDEMDLDDQPAASTSKPKTSSNAKKRKAGAGDVRVSRKRIKGKQKAILKDFVEMPMDILLEIFSHLEPMDLLHLARTTKLIRNILMDKSTRSVWKNSFQNADPPLPDCPDDMSEPAFAELTFGKGCSFCGRSNVTIHIAWQCRLRTCTKCIDAHFTEHQKDLGYGYGTAHAANLPVFKLMKNRAVGRPYVAKTYFSKDRDREWEAEYAALQNDQQRDEWYRQKIQEQRSMRTHAFSCEKWAEQKIQLRVKDQKSSIEDKRILVIEHLKTMGWGEELDNIPSSDPQPHDIPLVAKACQKSLSAKALQGLEPCLTSFMNRARETRIFRLRQSKLQSLLVALRDAYQKFLSTLPPAFTYPRTADIYQLSVIQDILNDCLDGEISDTHIERLKAAFPGIGEAWEAFVRQQLFQRIKDTLSNEVGSLEKDECISVDSEEFLKEASAQFSCHSCSLWIPAQVAATHLCSSRGFLIRRYIHDSASNMEEKAVRNALKESLWNAKDSFTFRPKMSAQITSILSSMGYSPKITASELNKLDPIFECLKCNDELSGRCTMKWTMIANHVNSNHRIDETFMYFKCIPEPHASAVRARIDEFNILKFAGSYDPNSAMCQRCGEKGKYAMVLDHVRSGHAIERPKLGQDVLANPNIIFDYNHRLWPPLPKEDVQALFNQTHQGHS